MQAANNATNSTVQPRKTIAANQIDLNMADMNEGLDSPKDKLAGDSDDMQSNDMPLMGSQNRQRNREGIISKPKPKRVDMDKQPANLQRTPQVQNERVIKNNIAGTRKLSQSPSVVNINGHFQGDQEGQDDDQPQKPIIIEQSNESEFTLPNLADKHKALHAKKGSVVIQNNKFLGESESQHSNSQDNLLKPVLASKHQPVNVRDHKLQQAPRVISKMRGDKVMQVYQQQYQPSPPHALGRNDKQLIYNTPSQA